MTFTPSRSAARRIAGAGAAGLAATLAAAPLAHAAPSPTHDSSAKSGKDGTTSPSTKPAKKAAVAPVYGFQKYRVGVQVKSGAYVPPGTSTGGTVLTLTESGPGIEAITGQKSITGTCTTDASTQVEGSTATFCEQTTDTLVSAARVKSLRRQLKPALTVQPTPPGVPTQELEPLFPGDTLTVTQKTVNPNLVIDPATATLAPCEADFVFDEIGFCTAGSDESFVLKSTDEIFDDNGPLPVAANDSAKTDEGKSVKIEVTENDSTKGAPVAGLAVGADPKHGTATVLAGSSDPVGPTPTAPAPATSTDTALARPAAARRAAAAPAAAAPAAVVAGSTIRYTPTAGFSGTDTFTYRLSTVNGTATARVTVTVAAAPSSSSAPSSSTPAASSSSSGDLANTGSNSQGLSEIALGLLVVGGVATAAGRRRRVAARHARTD